MQWVTETLPGSAKRAMNIRPPFKHFIFNESDDEHQKALRAIREANKSLDIEIIGDDANAAISEIFSRPVWRRGAFGAARAVVFLDPYALQVNWSTLALLAKTQCVDVWYLFPLHDVTRQLANKRSGIGPKEKRLDQVLGSAWRELYNCRRQQIGCLQTRCLDQFQNLLKRNIATLQRFKLRLGLRRDWQPFSPTSLTLCRFLRILTARSSRYFWRWQIRAFQPSI